ncbi:MAG TPA: winged helix-turn-helix domain-containing protein [Solirubrobacterales bacterium]
MPRRAVRSGPRQNRLKALSHPLRAKILRILSEREASPKELAREVGTSLGNASYHAKYLVELDCAELVREEKVRGAMEHFYRATERSLIGTGEWDEMNRAEALSHLAETMELFLEDFLASEKAKIVGHDREFHLTRTPMTVDQEGLGEILEIFEQTRLKVAEVERRSAERSGGGRGESIRVSSLQGLIKMPPRR